MQSFPLTAWPAAISFSGEKCVLPLSETDFEPKSNISIPVKVVFSSRKLEDNQTGQIKIVSNVGQISSPFRSEYLHINITGEERAKSYQPGEKQIELKDSERTKDTFDGQSFHQYFL